MVPKKILERSISKKVGRAIADYKMIEDGDKVLVAVSGGKDSLALLKILSQRRAFVPIKYDIIVVHVDLGHQGINKRVLEKFVRDEGHVIHFRKTDILKKSPKSEMTCFWCSWNRRKVLFESANEWGCNKIAFGHHKDDIVQTILMNLLFEGEVSAMAPHQKMFKGKISIIRPLAYVEEKEVETFVRANHFPQLPSLCPNSRTSRRALVAKFINEVEIGSPGVKTNIFRSLQRIKKDYLL